MALAVVVGVGSAQEVQIITVNKQVGTGTDTATSDRGVLIGENYTLAQRQENIDNHRYGLLPAGLTDYIASLGADYKPLTKQDFGPDIFKYDRDHIAETQLKYRNSYALIVKTGPAEVSAIVFLRWGGDYTHQVLHTVKYAPARGMNLYLNYGDIGKYSKYEKSGSPNGFTDRSHGLEVSLAGQWQHRWLWYNYRFRKVSEASAIDPLVQAELDKLNWVNFPGRNVSSWVSEGRSEIHARPGIAAIGGPDGGNCCWHMGGDARRYLQLTKRKERPTLILISVNRNTDTQILFSYYEIGHIGIEGFDDIDPADLLKTIKKRTIDKNQERKKKGLPELIVKGWVTQPTLNDEDHSVRWAISHTEDGIPMVTAMALVLGKVGFTRLVSVTTQKQYSAEYFETMLKDYYFYGCCDFKEFGGGDKINEHSIDSLVSSIAVVEGIKD